MAFLGEIQLVQTREKYSIKINVEKIIKVLQVLAGERIGGPVRAGKSIHKGVKRAAYHHEKRIANRIPFAAAQGGVLKNVSDAGGVMGNRAQSHQKNVFIIVCRYMNMLRTRRFMAIFFDAHF